MKPIDNETYIKDLVIKYNHYLFKVIRNATKTIDETDIEDIIQDTFIIIWKNINKIDDIKNMKAYLSVIAKNLLKKRYKNMKITYDLSDYENFIADSLSLDNFIEQKEKETLIQKELDNLHIEDRKVFIEYYFSSKKTKEIAKSLNISNANVKVKLHRIRKKFRKILKEKGYGNHE